MFVRKSGWDYEHEIFRSVFAGKRPHHFPATAGCLGTPKGDHNADRLDGPRTGLPHGGTSQKDSRAAKEKASELCRAGLRDGFSQSNTIRQPGEKTGYESSIALSRSVTLQRIYQSRNTGKRAQGV